MEASDWLGLMADILPVQWILVAGQKETGVTFSENKPLVIFLYFKLIGKSQSKNANKEKVKNLKTFIFIRVGYSLIRSDRSDQMSDCERFT